ncbi:hsp90-like protein [Phlyctema vagabunda]|uniref:Hsp90-like protein n=1 Tax=Phlyctema vagabunda TaxID=108571 RepID=A0ABR4PSY0_9HELO
MSDPGKHNPGSIGFLPPSEITIERVYPIRNLVTQLEGILSKRDVDEPASRPQFGTKPPISPRSSHGSGTEDSNESRKVSERFKLIPSRAGSAPNVLPGAGADNEKPAYRTCEDEPIHIPGAIQSYGALVGLKYSEKSQLEVRIASENTRKVLGYGPEQLFALPSFLDILNGDARDEMVARVAHALANAGTMGEETRLDVFQMLITFPYEPETRLWCAIHCAPSPKRLVICEFEEYADAFYLKDVSNANVLPVNLVRSTGVEASPEEFRKSTQSRSQPLPVIKIARLRKQKEFSSLDIFNAMTQSQRQLSTAKSVQEIFDVVVGIISELTGFHRVMFYRFDSQKNGCIESELLNPQASSDIYRGLHYPASDIPKQARDLYKINRIRILYDRDAETARLVARNETDFEEPLDLTHSYLRAISPVHIKYLTNMGVRSTMSISIVINEDLWGLIACHGYGDSGIRVSLPIRELCRNIGECAATNIERLLMVQRLEARKPLFTPPPTHHPASFIAASSADLLRIFDSDFGLINIQDEARAIGRLDPYREALALLAYIQTSRWKTIRSSQNINTDFPDLKYSPGLQTISGLLFVPLGVGGNNFLVFFRRGQLREVKWAGYVPRPNPNSTQRTEYNPYHKSYKHGSEYLEPRTSFKRWVETISGMSREWTEDQLESASILSLLYGRFVEIWKQKESASQNTQMTRLLIRNSSQEVRTPLNSIINYLEMALDNNIDDLTREILKRALKASSSLIYTIDDLLKLTKAEDGPVYAIKDNFNMSKTVQDVATEFQKEASHKQLDLTFTAHEGIPEIVKGDATRLRKIIFNLTSNAFQHSLDKGVRVDIRKLKSNDHSCIISISVQDSGPGMSETQLDDLFQSFEQVLDEEDNLYPKPETLMGRSEPSSCIGVGLSLVARYVRNMNGQIRVKSELGKGTIFAVELPFEYAITPHSTPPTAAQPASCFNPSMIPRPQSEPPVPSPANLPPFMKSGSLGTKQILKVIETRTHLEKNFSPLTDIEPFATAAESGEYDQALSLASSDTEERSQYPGLDDEGQSSLVHLDILVAEDNPIYLRLLDKRLNRRGHKVHIVCDGQEAYEYLVNDSGQIDVILMNLQMPLVDGALSTRMIRYHEQEKYEKVQEPDSKTRRRVPIIAVSGHLEEDSRFDYIQSGFDGWITKPIDWSRLDFMLQCVKIPELRRDAIYVPGTWDQGGWFMP